MWARLGDVVDVLLEHNVGGDSRGGKEVPMAAVHMAAGGAKDIYEVMSLELVE